MSNYPPGDYDLPGEAEYYERLRKRRERVRAERLIDEIERYGYLLREEEE